MNLVRAVADGAWWRPLLDDAPILSATNVTGTTLEKHWRKKKRKGASNMPKLCVEKMRLQDRLSIERCYRIGFGDVIAWIVMFIAASYVMAHVMLWGSW